MLWSVIYNYPRAGLHVGLHASMSLVGSMGGAGATGYDARPVPRRSCCRRVLWTPSVNRRLTPKSRFKSWRGSGLVRDSTSLLTVSWSLAGPWRRARPHAPRSSWRCWPVHQQTRALFYTERTLNDIGSCLLALSRR